MSVAFHEAGHLVASIIFNHNPKRASIIQEGNTHGIVTSDTMIRNFDPWPRPDDYYEVKRVSEFRKNGFVSLWDPPRILRKKVRKVVISTLAGYEAELKFDPNADVRYSNEDYKNIFHMLELGGYSIRTLEDNTINYPYLNILHKRTKELVENHWQEIEMVAHLLLEKKKLNEDDIKKLAQEILSAIK